MWDQQHIDSIKPTKKRVKENCWSGALKSTLKFLKSGSLYLQSTEYIYYVNNTKHWRLALTCLAKHKKHIDSTKKMLHNAVQPPCMIFGAQKPTHKSCSFPSGLYRCGAPAAGLFCATVEPICSCKGLPWSTTLRCLCIYDAIKNTLYKMSLRALCVLEMFPTVPCWNVFLKQALQEHVKCVESAMIKYFFNLDFPIHPCHTCLCVYGLFFFFFFSDF